MEKNLLEAERRIAVARETRAEWLDLGDLGLSELPASLGDLPYLKTLCLGQTGVTEAGKLEWHPTRSAPAFTDLQPLAGLKALESLDLFRTGVADLQPLAGLKALQTLDLYECTVVTNLQPLAGLKALQTLDLYYCRPAISAELVRTFADHPHLTELVANEAVGVPQEVLSHDSDDNCLPRLRTYLGELALVFHRGRAVPWLRDSGRFTREDLAWLAWPDHSPEEQKLFLGLMESCGVCFRCGGIAQGEPSYVAPDLLPGFEAVQGRLHAWKEEPGMPTLRLEYRFFHQAVIRGLMRDLGWRAGDLAEYWKYGFWFKDGRRDTQILIQFEDTSTAEATGAGALVLKALGRDPLGLLREIRRMTLRQRIGEKPEELLTLDGTTVARSALAAAIDLPGKPALSPAFAAFFEDREYDFEELAISPQPLTENEKPREVFLSYAWGDDTPEGKIRALVVDELQSALEKDGLTPVRDRDRLRPGDRISAFMRQLTRADLVVAVISNKYLRSPYCMYEIYKLWQRFQGDADALARSVVPIVLPGGEGRERAPEGALRQALEAGEREAGEAPPRAGPLAQLRVRAGGPPGPGVRPPCGRHPLLPQRRPDASQARSAPRQRLPARARSFAKADGGGIGRKALRADLRSLDRIQASPIRSKLLKSDLSSLNPI